MLLCTGRHPCSCASALGLCSEHAVLTCRVAAEVGVEHLKFLPRAELVAAESSRLHQLYAGRSAGADFWRALLERSLQEPQLRAWLAAAR